MLRNLNLNDVPDHQKLSWFNQYIENPKELTKEQRDLVKNNWEYLKRLDLKLGEWFEDDGD